MVSATPLPYALRSLSTKTFLAPVRASQSAPCEPSTLSLAMMRCQQFQPCCCNVALDAEAVMIGIDGLAAQKLLFTARLSPENAGPMVAMTLGSEMSVVAAAGAFSGRPSESCGSRATLNLYLPDELAWSMASWAPCFSLMPSWAFAPLNAPMKPMVYVGVLPPPPLP